MITSRAPSSFSKRSLAALTTDSMKSLRWVFRNCAHGKRRRDAHTWDVAAKEQAAADEAGQTRQGPEFGAMAGADTSL